MKVIITGQEIAISGSQEKYCFATCPCKSKQCSAPSSIPSSLRRNPQTSNFIVKKFLQQGQPGSNTRKWAATAFTALPNNPIHKLVLHHIRSHNTDSDCGRLLFWRDCHTFRWQISVVYRFARAPSSSEKTATVLGTISVAVLSSHDFSDSPLPPNLVLQQCKYTHQAQENQLSKNYWCSPAQSTQMRISPTPIQSGWKLVTSFTMAFTFRGL